MFDKKEGILAHIRWVIFKENKEVWGRGIAGVKYIPAFERLRVKQLAGEAPPACLLLPVLDVALGEGWAEEAERLHLSRANPWRMEVRTGASGARDYRLRVLEDGEFGYAPVRALLHVSMSDKLNEGVDLWLGAVPPLMAKLLEAHPPPPRGSYTVEACGPRPLGEGGFGPPGAPSGLLGQIGALEVLEALGGEGGA